MTMLQSLSALVRRPGNRPAPTLDARDYYDSIICSADDDTGPSPRLIELSLETIRRSITMDLSPITSRPNVPDWFTVWPGEHYRLLASMIDVLQPRVVIELGTFSGLSALAMKQALPPEGQIHTFDIVPWRQVPNHLLTDDDFADNRLTQHLKNLADEQTFEQYRPLLESAEFFFIDGPKDGKTEYIWMRHFQTLNFKKPPILMFDDTRLLPMVPFWRTLKHPKLDLTSFGHWSGTGIVEWQPRAD